MSDTPRRAIPGGLPGRRHLIVAHAQNRPGVINRVASLLRARDFNIETFTASHTAEAEISHMTITTVADDVTVEQMTKQLYRLIDVVRVVDLTDTPHVERELLLARVECPERDRPVLVNLVEAYGGRIIGFDRSSALVECAGSEARLDELLASLGPLRVRELVRTGAVALRGID